ncbi:MAG: class I SAM-dependent methyltransferase [Desulfobaccales bacterium]
MPKKEVKYKLWMEALDQGYNIKEDCKLFNVIAHKYNNNMIELYSNSYSFIYETMAFWARPSRQKWIKQALDRIDLYTQKAMLDNKKPRILMFGDGVGNDSLFLLNNGYIVDYFDFPGSKTFEFAQKRFMSYGLLGEWIYTKTDYDSLFLNQYDVIICFEVIEHLVDPKSFIRDLFRLLKENGVVLITEAFAYIVDRHPTHLASNAIYAGRTPFLFNKEGFRLSWYSKSPLFKPMEFTKSDLYGKQEYINLLRDKYVIRAFLHGLRSYLKRRCYPIFKRFFGVLL